jgi:hypothetical protein
MLVASSSVTQVMVAEVSVMFPAATDDIVNGLAEAGATGTANRSTAVSTAIAILCSQSRVFNRRFISYSAESRVVPQLKCI